MMPSVIEAAKYCDRCHCSVPLSEWRVSLAARGVRHTRCGFFEPFPWAKALDPEAR